MNAAETRYAAERHAYELRQLELARPCPFCGSRELSVSWAELNDLDRTKRYMVECHKCAATGPESPSRIDAIDLWKGTTS